MTPADAVDVLVGGTPCQSFSVAGGRAGLDDPRGHLAVEFVRLARRVGARWVVWENVPGVLSADGGDAFGTFLSLLADVGYGVFYRVLDARWFGVPQRRRRVFLVGYLGDWRPSCAVLLERPSMRGNPATRRSARTRATDGAGGSAQELGESSVTNALLSCAGRSSYSSGPLIADTIGTLGAHHYRNAPDDPIVADTLRSQGRAPDHGHIAFHTTQDPISGPAAPCLGTEPGSIGIVGSGALARRPRRMTPREWERLQGFPDDYTLVDGADDSPRYEALGNSMAVPVMRWIGERLVAVDRLLRGGG
jgi:DNA (cytosine-5)-methyltransferase 1